MTTVAGFILCIAALLVRIVWWSRRPGLFSCCIFWGILLSGFVMSDYLLFIPGLICNAVATIANGGFMPVKGGINLHGKGIHAPLNPDTKMVFLVDRFCGASVGDFLIIVAMLIPLVLKIVS